MATLYPDLANIDRLTVPPTDGERHLLNVLSDTLDDTYDVYFNPYLDGDRPDVIVLKPGCGALIIEVKDWNLNHYQVDINSRWLYEGKAIRSPQQQAFRYKENLFNLHLPVLGLQHLTNRNFYKLITVSVYFHRTSREQLNHLYSKSLDEIHRQSQQLNRDRLHIGQEKYDQHMDWCNRARYKLDRDLSMSWRTDNLVKKVRMFDKLGKNPLFTSDIHEDFERRLRPPVHTQQQGVVVAFDAKQQALTTSKPGFEKVKGVAGCGKTTILAQRAINAHARHRGQVLILTFNITLRHYIRDTISRLRGGGDRDHYEVIHYHAFISNQLNNFGIDLKSKLEQFSLDQRADLNVVFGMKSLFVNVETEKYPTILIDEVQDYAPEWIKLVRDCFLADDGEMVLFGDQSQNIYDRPSDGRESPIVQGFGRWIRLTKSYRSERDAPLLQLFRNFQMQHLIQKYTDSEIFEAKTGQTSMCYDLLSYEIYGATYDSAVIIEKIQRYIRKYQLHPNDIALVSSKVELLMPLNEALKRTEKTKVMFEETSEVEALAARMGRDSPQFREEIAKIRRCKKCFFMQNSGLIKISTIHSFKGLEAQTVFCILAPEDEAEMVYTGITRAQRNLVIFDSSASSYRTFFQTHIAVVDVPQVTGQ
ncbi:MAG: NERD domain-containing protein [Gammaproteobacteria bacterium]|nr:NERD domain-containing protein [Gammaproteobacteria bacterium]MBU3996995.1 NERD domain-containing protein [Gammaproteobacteria bacterium]MBU4081430.1 NERD domain-containing protein [Gammaproteobacteria bacterium]MBU4170070.1 NERD domain-containing protein [Gammaproteobacteria bacterium]